MIAPAVKPTDMPGIVKAMRDHDNYTKEYALPKYKELLNLLPDGKVEKLWGGSWCEGLPVG